ncbi:unnamed protein product [Penicillium palitans]
MAGKNAFMNALALSSFWVRSSEPTRSAGTQPHVSRGFMYVAAFQSFPSPASSRNCFQCEDLAFSMVLVHARRFCCIASKAAVVLACSLPSSAQFAYHLLRSWLTSTCWVLRSGVNHGGSIMNGRIANIGDKSRQRPKQNNWRPVVGESGSHDQNFCIVGSIRKGAEDPASFRQMNHVNISPGAEFANHDMSTDKSLEYFCWRKT